MHAGFQAPAPGLYSTAARGKVWSVLKKLKVAVLFGGASSEHEVSRMSATSVLNNLDTEKYDVLPVGITKDGRWYLYSGPVEAPLRQCARSHLPGQRAGGACGV